MIAEAIPETETLVAATRKIRYPEKGCSARRNREGEEVDAQEMMQW
jgi:hypothetical protein